MPTTAPLSNRKLAAVLAADVAGYSRLMQHDDEATVTALKRSHHVFDSCVGRHGGRVVHTAGDSVLAEFGSVVSAVRCAVEIQKALREQTADVPEERPMRWRIGINLGDILTEGEDVHGDGVNIATRVQALAEPGGICISGVVYSQVRNNLTLGYEFLGRHKVKNIAEPVPVYRIALEGRQRAFRFPRVLAHRRVTFGLSVLALAALAGVAYWQGSLPGFQHQPPSVIHTPATAQMSLVVLPFANLNHDPAQDYFSDGLTNELIISLSKLPSLFVIASHSAFVYKGKPAKVQELGNELGVRYIVAGSVQKSGNRVRITAQLVDATTGYQLWGDRYDRRLADIFALQDEVTRQIVAALSLTLNERERRLLAARYTHSVDAYDLFLRGRALYIQSTRETNREARAMLTHAIDLDPDFARAHATLALTHAEDFRYRWSTDHLRSKQRALEVARNAVRLDKTSSQTYQVLSYVYLFVAQQTAEAIEAAERAIVLDPNNADAYATLGVSKLYHGQPEEAVGVIRRAMRLNPLYPSQYAAVLGQAYYFGDQFDEAVTVLEDAVSRNYSRLASHLFLVASLSHLGRLDEARWEASELLALDPSFVVDEAAKVFPVRNPARLERLKHDLHQAGLK